jgi:hypothetical protein
MLFFLADASSAYKKKVLRVHTDINHQIFWRVPVLRHYFLSYFRVDHNCILLYIIMSNIICRNHDRMGILTLICVVMLCTTFSFNSAAADATALELEAKAISTSKSDRMFHNLSLVSCILMRPNLLN